MLKIKHFSYSVLSMMTLFVCLLVSVECIGGGADLRDLDDKAISLKSLRGKWVFINYWASWCGPCVDEIAELNQFYEANSKDKVALFAVNYEALSLTQQHRLVRYFNIHYPSLQLKSLRGLQLGAVNVVPMTYVFDPEGHLVKTLYGGQTQRSLQKLIS